MVKFINNIKELEEFNSYLKSIIKDNSNLYLVTTNSDKNISTIEYSLKNYSIREGKKVYKLIILILNKPYKKPSTTIYKNGKKVLEINGIPATVD